MEARRIRRVEVSTELVGMLLLFGPSARATRISELPDDVRVVHFNLDPQRDVLIVFVYSASFDVVPEFAVPPMLEITYRAE